MFKYFIEAASENNNSTNKTLETQKVKINQKTKN